MAFCFICWALCLVAVTSEFWKLKSSSGGVKVLRKEEKGERETKKKEEERKTRKKGVKGEMEEKKNKKQRKKNVIESQEKIK